MVKISAQKTLGSFNNRTALRTRSSDVITTSQFHITRCERCHSPKAKAPQHISLLVCSVEIHSTEINRLFAMPEPQWMGALPDNLNWSVLKESVWQMVQWHPDTMLQIKEQVRIYNRDYSSKYNSKPTQEMKETVKQSIKANMTLHTSTVIHLQHWDLIYTDFSMLSSALLKQGGKVGESDHSLLSG